MRPLLAILRQRGWELRMAAGQAPLLPTAVAARYPGLPEDLLAFLSALVLCRSPDESVWFLTHDDFACGDGPGFGWNAYECMAKEEAGADGDAASMQQIAQFWDAHFPFMLAVHSDYDYLALRLGDGAVVHGYAPYWEEPSVVAPSFAAFLQAFAQAASSSDPGQPHGIFLGAAGSV